MVLLMLFCACSEEHILTGITTEQDPEETSDDGSELDMPIDAKENCALELVDWATIETSETNIFLDESERFGDSCLNLYPDFVSTFAGHDVTALVEIGITWKYIRRIACEVDNGYFAMRSVDVGALSNVEANNFYFARDVSDDCLECELNSSAPVTLVTNGGLLIDFGRDFRIDFLQNAEGDNTVAAMYPESSTMVESIVFRRSSFQSENWTIGSLKIAPNCGTWTTF